MAIFNEDVVINGALDINGTDNIAQLEVQAAATQTAPLQTWKKEDETTLAQVTGDGRLEIGTLDMGTPDALIEANSAITLPSSVPVRGVQSLGRVTANSPQTLGDGTAWSVQELELLGNAVVSGIHTALRGKLTQQNTGNANQAELRAADFEAINEGGNGTQPVGRMVGVQSTVTNEVGGHLNEAVGIGVTINDEGTSPVSAAYGLRVDSLPASASEAYAIHTGDGPVHLGDFVELKRPAATPGQPETDFIRIYPKSDGKLYAKNWNNQEFDLTGGADGGSPIAGLCYGRLTLSSGTPIPITDALAATTVYFSPYSGNQLSLYDGSKWNAHTWSEISINLTDTQNGTTAIGSAIVTGLTNTSQFIVGMNVSGTGIPANATIQSIDSATQITLNQNATASGTASLTFKMPANTPYDIFVYNNAGTLTLEAVSWNAPDNGTVTSINNASPRVVTVPSHTLSTGQLVTIAGNSVASNNATWRVGTTTSTTFQLLNLDGTSSSAPGGVGTGGTWRRADQNTSRATSLALQDGVYVKSGAAGHRYLGTIRTTNVAGQCEDSTTKRFVWNYSQRIMRQLLKTESTNTWTYSSQAWRRAHNLDANRVEVVVGVAETPLELAVYVMSNGSADAVSTVVGIGEDTPSSNSADIWHGSALGTGLNVTEAFLQRYPLGYHYYQWVEYCVNPGTANFYSYSANLRRSGLKGWIWG